MAFIKWWWAKRDDSEKFLIGSLCDLIISAAAVPFIGIKAVLLFAVIAIFIMISFIIFHIVGSIRKDFAEFKEMKEKEAEKILQKLRGVNEDVPRTGPTTPAKTGHAYSPNPIDLLAIVRKCSKVSRP